MANVRIACTSNYDIEMFEESFVNVPLMPEDTAWKICHLINNVNPSGPNYFKPVPVNYVLYKFEP